MDSSYISASDIETYVSKEPWTDLLEGGCTLYGFTCNTYNDAVKELKALMDSLAPHLSQLAELVLCQCAKDSSDLEDVLQTEAFRQYLSDHQSGEEPMLSRKVFLLHLKLAFDKKRSWFKPKALELDHFFLRGSLQVIKKSIHSVSSVEKMTSGQPLPILDEPSDQIGRAHV